MDEIHLPTEVKEFPYQETEHENNITHQGHLARKTMKTLMSVLQNQQLHNKVTPQSSQQKMNI